MFILCHSLVKVNNALTWKQYPLETITITLTTEMQVRFSALLAVADPEGSIEPPATGLKLTKQLAS
jgi:hypothetical protein